MLTTRALFRHRGCLKGSCNGSRLCHFHIHVHGWFRHDTLVDQKLCDTKIESTDGNDIGTGTPYLLGGSENKT